MPKKVVLEDKPCKYCGGLFSRGGSKSSDFREKKFCNRGCYHAYNRGENSGRYVRGYRIRPDGYLRDTNDVYIHRKVMESHLGRPLRTEEHIHHIDGNPANNSIENLQILSNSKHRKTHAKTAKRDAAGRWASKNSPNNRN